MGLFSNWLSWCLDGVESVLSPSADPIVGSSFKDDSLISFGPNDSWSMEGTSSTFETGPSFDLGVNPASGLPMIPDSMVDVAGNPYGSDLTKDTWSSHDSWSRGGISSGDDW